MKPIQKGMLFACPFLFVYSRLLYFLLLNVSEIPFHDFFRPVFVSSVIVLGVLFSFYKLNNGDLSRSSLMTSATIVIFFLGGKLNTMFQRLLSGEALLLFRLAIFIILLFSVLFLIKKIKQVSWDITKIVFSAGIVMMAISLQPITKYLSVSEEKQLPFQINSSKKMSPDINVYLIVLDSYSRGDKVKSIYGGDNSWFLDSLKKKDFFVADRSRSNYTETMVSVPTLFNMNYAGDISNSYRGTKYSAHWAKSAIENNALMKILNKGGHKFYAINTGCLFTNPDTATILYSPYTFDGLFRNPMTLYERIVISRTAIGLFTETIFSDEEIAQQQNRVMSALHALEQSIDITGPKVVFAHILSPHEPYIFDRKGNRIKPSIVHSFQSDHGPGTARDPRSLSGYAEQLDFISNRIDNVVSEIVQKDSNDIIIIVGDHGGRSGLWPGNPDKTDIEDCYSNLIAIRAPGIQFSDGEHDMTLVNLFRFILKKYVDDSIPLLENRQFFHFGLGSKDPIEITERFKPNGPG